MCSQEGQERVIREALDLCPSEKLLWSTDGHWFPETYFLATKQFKQGLLAVLSEYVERDVLTIDKAITVVEDVYFRTSNRLYGLGLELKSFSISASLADLAVSTHSSVNDKFHQLQAFLKSHPSVHFIQTQWLDYTATLRARVLPTKQALRLLKENKNQTVSKVALGALPGDVPAPGFVSTGEDQLVPILSSLSTTSRSKYASVNCEIRKMDGTELAICPRTLLRHQEEKAERMGISFLVGHEIEVVYMSRSIQDGKIVYGRDPSSLEGEHSWCNVRALHDNRIAKVNEAIISDLEAAGIEILAFHPESAPGQVGYIPFSSLSFPNTLLLSSNPCRYS